MHPKDTQYFLASEPEHYSLCHQFAKKLGSDAIKFGWPTIVAVRDMEVVGLLSTHRRRDAIYAGPLLVEKQSPVLVMRLIEAYEQVLQTMGVAHYWFGTDTPEMDNMAQKMMQKTGAIKVVNQTEAGTLYRRDMRA